MIEIKLNQAINWETLIVASNDNKELLNRIWKENLGVLSKPLLTHFAYFAGLLNLTDKQLSDIYNKVKASFQNLPEDTVILSKEDELWPQKINDFPYCPKFLYCQGKVELLQKKSIAIAGTQSPSQKAKNSLKKTVSALVKSELIIATNLSLGVGGLSSAESISHFAPTIAVIGTSLDKFYPPYHENMQRFIASEGGLVITHCSPYIASQNYKWNFLLRNRLLSALSEAIVIIEDRDSGGAIKMAEFACENNRKVYFYSYLLNKSEITWPSEFKNKDGVKSVRFPGNLVNSILGISKKPKVKKEKVESVVQLSLFK